MPTAPTSWHRPSCSGIADCRGLLGGARDARSGVARRALDRAFECACVGCATTKGRRCVLSGCAPWLVAAESCYFLVMMESSLCCLKAESRRTNERSSAIPCGSMRLPRFFSPASSSCTTWRNASLSLFRLSLYPETSYRSNTTFVHKPCTHQLAPHNTTHTRSSEESFARSENLRGISRIHLLVPPFVKLSSPAPGVAVDEDALVELSRSRYGPPRRSGNVGGIFSGADDAQSARRRRRFAALAAARFRGSQRWRGVAPRECRRAPVV